MSIKVLGKVRAGDQWEASGELRRRILSSFAANDIAMPHPNVVMPRSNES